MLLLLSWPAGAEDRVYYTFSQWAGLQEDDRAAYISGLLDTFAMAATEPAKRTAQHYSQCIMRSRLTTRQLANYLREYGRARPGMQGNSVEDVMTNYLNALCGQLPLDHAEAIINTALHAVMNLVAVGAEAGEKAGQR